MPRRIDKLKDCEIPKHIAFIMDGNGRWANDKGKKRTVGHREGSKTLKKICKTAYELGVEYITVYAFSTENWKRPKDEVDFLMDLLRQYLKDSIKESKKNNMRVTVIGNIDPLPDDLKEKIHTLHEVTKNFSGLKLQIALNYGGRNEIIRGIQKLIEDCKNQEISIDDINEEKFSGYLDTKEIPDPDLMIRTSGEIRISNFLLWQLAYTELYFTNKYWPDFDKNELIQAILEFNKKQRRFGGIL